MELGTCSEKIVCPFLSTCPEATKKSCSSADGEWTKTAGYEDFCLKSPQTFADIPQWSCRPIDSVNLIFFGVDDGFGSHIMNGNASELRKDATQALEDLIVR